MSSALDEVAALCAHTLRTSSLLLRGTPAAAGWVLGWMAAEFAPHVLTGHALSALPSPLERAAAGLAFQRAEDVLVTVSRWTLRLTETGWRDTAIALPAGIWTDRITGAAHSGHCPAATLFAELPVALLERTGG